MVINKKGPNGETVGRIVHFVTPEYAQNEELLAAVISKINNNRTVDLVVFNAEASPPVLKMSNVRHSATYERGCWSWPPRDASE